MYLLVSSSRVLLPPSWFRRKHREVGTTFATLFGHDTNVRYGKGVTDNETHEKKER